MATMEQCRLALETLAERLREGAAEGKASSLTRSMSCYLTDLDDGYSARLVDGQLEGITPGHDPKAKIKLSVSSDDLVALTSGGLSFTQAWSSGRVKVDASVFDLLKLRNLL